MHHNDTVARMEQLLAEFQEFHRQLLTQCVDVDQLIRNRELDRPDEVDLGFLLREIENTADEIRKEAAARKQFSGRIIAAELTQESLTSGKIGSVYGQLCSAYPDVGQTTFTPKPGGEPFKKLCGQLGLEGEAVELGLFKFSYRALADYLTERMKKGEQLPEGLEMQPDYKMIYRRGRPKKADKR